jgi:hypothetical protein
VRSAVGALALAGRAFSELRPGHCDSSFVAFWSLVFYWLSYIYWPRRFPDAGFVGTDHAKANRCLSLLGEQSLFPFDSRSTISSRHPLAARLQYQWRPTPPDLPRPGSRPGTLKDPPCRSPSPPAPPLSPLPATISIIGRQRFRPGAIASFSLPRRSPTPPGRHRGGCHALGNLTVMSRQSHASPTPQPAARELAPGIRSVWIHRLNFVEAELPAGAIADRTAFIRTYPDLTRFPDSRLYGHLPEA